MNLQNKIKRIYKEQMFLYLFFLLGILLQFCTDIEQNREIFLFLRIAFLTIALVGCSLTLALRDSVKSMMNSAAIDVSGIHNKKSLEKKLQQIEEKEDTLDIGIMMFDLNNLKLVNDTYGHEEGDRFIQAFASFLTRILNNDSFLARFGGDEFVIVQEHADPALLEQMNMHLQHIVDEYNIEAAHPISYAVGYDVSYKNHYYLVQDLMKIADHKMYQDKVYKKQTTNISISRAESGSRDHTFSVSAETLALKIHASLNTEEKSHRYAFLMSDIREFHLVNDYWGYKTGNEMLAFVLTRMTLFPGIVFAYRFHSDIFVCMVDVTDMEMADFAEKIRRYNNRIAGGALETFPVSYFDLDTGIYFIPDDQMPAEEIISHANIVRRKAKELPDGVCVYSEEIGEMELLRADVLHSYQAALEKEEFEIYFQPKIGGSSQQIISAEVLVRWNKDGSKIWAPDKFLSILEEMCKVEELDFYVYEKAFRWMAERRYMGRKPVTLSLNVSPVHFYKIEAFTNRLLMMIRQHEVDTRYLIFEITESVYIKNVQAVNQMIDILHQHGIRISMDDFGSGYSCLNALQDIVFDEVKIDKQFLDDSLSENGRIVVQEIFHLLKRTHKSIVCEGVETKEAADFLIEEGCDELQGYYYYKPMNATQFEKTLDTGV